MANPQKENGHIDIANEIAEKLARTQLNGYESRILWVIWRKTYGWNKKADFISNSQFVEVTGLHKAHVSRTLKRLIERNIVTKNGNKIGFQKDYTKWDKLPKMATKSVTKKGNKVTKSGNRVTKIGKKVTKNGGHKYHYTNTTYTNNNILSQNEKLLNSFDQELRDLTNEFLGLVCRINKSSKILDTRRLRLIKEIQEFKADYTKKGYGEEFIQALKKTVEKEVPSLAYTKAIMRSVINKKEREEEREKEGRLRWEREQEAQEKELEGLKRNRADPEKVSAILKGVIKDIEGKLKCES